MSLRFAILISPLVTVAAPAWAAVPAVLIPTAPLIDPGTALTYYNNPPSPAAPATRDPLVQEAARALRYDIDRIFEHVRDHVEFVPIFGVQKGARGVILDGAGTAFDQAQFMVEALREADAVAETGYNPAYVMGKITVSATDFASWTGVDDAAVAAKLLSSGGIPASVSGSGANFTVTMAHVWVKAKVGGTTYLFDPSFKPHSTVAETDWSTASGYTQSALLSAGGGASGGNILGFNTSSFRSQLATYRGNVEASIAANARGKSADSVIGYTDIVPHPAAENRRTALPYTASTDLAWSGQIPNVFRASFSVSFNGVAIGTFYADTVGEAAIGFTYAYQTASGNFVASSNSNVGTISGSSIDFPCDQYLGSQPTEIATVTIAINHPYAASGGTYADRTLSKQLGSKRCSNGAFFVSNDWGYTGVGYKDRIAMPASRQRADVGSRTRFIFGPTLASVASQYSALLDTAGRVGRNIYQVHDLIGVHTLDAVSMKLDPPGQYDTSTMLTMDFEGAVSAVAKSGGLAANASAAFIAGLGLSFAEGAVPRQEADAVYDMAAINLFLEQNSRTSTPGTYPTYLATPANWNSIQSSLASDYPADAKAAIGQYIAEGYSVLVPQHGGLRQPPITVASVATRVASLWEGFNTDGDGGELKRSAFLAWHPSGVGTTSVPDKFALVVWDPRHGRILKAGVGVALNPVSGLIRKPDAPKTASADLIRAGIDIDARSGAVTYTPPADLVDGPGDFPYSLSLRRVYDQRDGTNYGFGIGWKSNWNQNAILSNDGLAALGRGGASGVASTLVAMQAMGDLLASNQDAQHLYAATQVAAWLTDQTINNSVVITPGLDPETTFYRQASGTFLSAKGDGSTLTQSGAPSTGIINRRLYPGIGFTYVDRDGTRRSYLSPTPAPNDDISSPNRASAFSPKTIYMTNWAFPNGINVTTGFAGSLQVPDQNPLFRVANNLGYSIQRSAVDYGAKTETPTCPMPDRNPVFTPTRDAFVRYRTSAGTSASVQMEAEVGFTLLGDESTRCSDGQVPKLQTNYNSQALSATDPVGSIWRYGYSSIVTKAGSYEVLGAIYKPSSAPPDVTLTYGVDQNVRAVTDLGGNSWKYFSSPNRSEVLSPLQASATPANGTVTYFDRWGRAVRAIDPLLRETRTAYEDRGLPIVRTDPELGYQTTTYDVRGNPIQTIRTAKPGSGLADIVTGTTYVTGPNVKVCATPATCNKPSSDTDGRLHVTDYVWDAYGNLTSVTKPADADGVRPEITIGYATGLVGTDGATLRLPVSRTELISPGVTTTTAYRRDPANKFAVSAARVDAGTGGFDLRTCTEFDAAGNLISLSDPRQATCP